MRTVRALAVVLSICLSVMAQTAVPTGDQIIERVSPSVVLILVGSGNGQLAGVGSGLIVRDGVVLTANHVVKGMREVQVRLKNGEVHDRVELIASDERRDVAALRIAASGLAALPIGATADLRAGSPVFVVSNGAGLPWTASAGILSAVRPADEVPGAGSGYRLLQITAPLSPGSSGGVVVDAQGRALGIVTGFVTGGQNLNFAVPLDSVAGLASIAGGTAFASGSRLQLPTAPQPGSAAGSRGPALPAAATQPVEVPRNSQVRSISVHSRTVYLRRERLQDDLKKQALFGELGMRFADYGETADVQVTVDRPFLTYDWTYTLVHQASGITLASGSIEAVDEFDAGPKLSAQIMEQLAAAAALPRGALDTRKAAAAEGQQPKPGRTAAGDPVQALRSCRTIFVESHTIYLKGNQLQDALFVRPELREWGMKIVDDRAGADVYIDVTRPFLTFDWVYKMIDTRTGAVLGTGKVIAWDGPIAAPQLAVEIMKRFRAARPATTKGE